ncbi:hypothetical protein HDV64DRAFT_5554 [Trichoderma sp. TUCIM 5745]
MGCGAVLRYLLGLESTRSAAANGSMARYRPAASPLNIGACMYCPLQCTYVAAIRTDTYNPAASRPYLVRWIARCTPHTQLMHLYRRENIRRLYVKWTVCSSSAHVFECFLNKIQALGKETSSQIDETCVLVRSQSTPRLKCLITFICKLKNRRAV